MANHPIFGGTIKGKRLERIKKSPNYKDGVFQNLSLTPSLAEGFTMRKVLWEFLTDKTPNKVPNKKIPSTKTDLKNQKLGDNFLVWMGHSSYYFQLSGKRFLVDPVLSGNASPIPGTTKSFAGTDFYTTDDILDVKSLKKTAFVTNLFDPKNSQRQVAVADKVFENIYKLHLFNFENLKAEMLQSLQKRLGIRYVILLSLSRWDAGYTWARAIKLDNMQLVFVQNLNVSRKDDLKSVVASMIDIMQKGK